MRFSGDRQQSSTDAYAVAARIDKQSRKNNQKPPVVAIWDNKGQVSEETGGVGVKMYPPLKEVSFHFLGRSHNSQIEW